MNHGDVYEHYKNVNYTFMGITSPINEAIFACEYLVELKAKDEATGEIIIVHEYRNTQDQVCYYADLPIQHVLYESHKDGQLWLRNPVDFFGPIDNRSPLRFLRIGE